MSDKEMSSFSSDESSYYTDEEEMYQQMGLIKLKDLETIPLSEVKRKLDKKMGKRVVDVNEVEEEIIPEQEVNKATRSCYREYEQGSTSQQNTSLRPKEFLEKTAKFGVRIMPNHRPNKRELLLEPISETGYKLNLDGVRNREDVLDFWKKSMMSVLNMNPEWRSENFLNYIEHSMYGIVADWYEGIDEETKETLRAIEPPDVMFRQFCKVLEYEFVGDRDDKDKKLIEWQRKLNTLEICNMRFLENYLSEFEQYYYKVGENAINLQMLFDKLPKPINEEISEGYQEWIEKYNSRDTLGNRLRFIRRWVEKKCREVKGTQHMKRQFLNCWDMPGEWGCNKRDNQKNGYGRKNYRKKSFNKQRGEKYQKKYYKKPFVKTRRFF